MTLFTIERDFGHLTDNELEAAAFRAKVCAPYFRGLRWIRSFRWAGLAYTRCFYVAETALDVKSHAMAAGVPHDDIRPVEEIFLSAPHREGLTESPVRDPDGLISLWVSRHRLGDGLDAYKAAMAQRRQDPGTGWALAYLDPQADEILTVYLAPGLEEAKAFSHVDGVTLLELTEAVEVMPADFTAESALVSN
jgi:hypothetical protein